MSAAAERARRRRRREDRCSRLQPNTQHTRRALLETRTRGHAYFTILFHRNKLAHRGPVASGNVPARAYLYARNRRGKTRPGGPRGPCAIALHVGFFVGGCFFRVVFSSVLTRRLP